MNPKRKGGAFERENAKELSKWIFEDSTILRRESSSGAIKDLLTGDIIPVGQIPDSHGYLRQWPFHIECKTGYKDDAPDFWKHSIIDKWYRKCVEESKIHNQHIIFLICRFKNRRKLLITNEQLNTTFNIIINIDNNPIFVYEYNNVIQTPFNEIFIKEYNGCIN
jgi:hypothetical protein